VSVYLTRSKVVVTPDVFIISQMFSLYAGIDPGSSHASSHSFRQFSESTEKNIFFCRKITVNYVIFLLLILNE